MNHILKSFVACVCSMAVATGYAQQDSGLKNDFSHSGQSLKVIGRGSCKVENGVLKSKDAYVCFGDPQWSNYVISFKARAPRSAEQVQIWAGFRAFNRNDRYVVGIKGGLQDDLYLSRMGYMGTDELMDLRPLGFHPVPGTWYDVKIEVCKNRIRVFVGDNKLPYIDVTDKNGNLAPSGEVTLGGGWIETEFDDLTITPVEDTYLNRTSKRTLSFKLTPKDKDSKRVKERAAYKPVTVDNLSGSRSEISLDGNWLFMPTYQLDDEAKAISAATDDQDWHVMSVPNFWNPVRIWLHGESMQSAAGRQAKGVSDTYFQQETDRCENYTFDYNKVKAAWYRQWVELPEDVKGKRMVLNFDAVSKVAEVYINGQLAASHIGMFGDFEADGTKLFKPGKNLVVVKVTRDFVKNIADADKVVDVAVTVPVTNSMLKDIAHGFYCDNPAGIWQPVKLTITNPMKVEDVFIKPALDGATFEITVNNHAEKKGKFDVNAKIVNKKTGEVLYSGTLLKNRTLNANEEKVFTTSINNLKPLLWSPQHPNLYNFSFTVVSGKKESDTKTITSGFRTFEVKEGLFFLNGNRYWFRGGNHTPYALVANDRAAADNFYQVMKAGNIEVTRTHTCPYNEVWMDAADENGIGVSYEGTWPWLMIHESMPDQKLIDMWADEWLGMLKKYRNHPSLLIWTVNNEMKFYDNDKDLERAKKKSTIISDVVKGMRTVDPTRPICYDSNYQAKGKEQKYGKAFWDTIDDGDIDDVHSYINWYTHTIFKQFKGELQRDFKMPGRPLISQEMATGYPNNETGHPTRFYTLVHYNPQSWVGEQAYAFGNPNCFLEAQSFITSELAEALRRSNDQGSGTIHFALLTWFRSVYDKDKIDPYPVYYRMKRALQPVLVSAELWGRHFYAGEKLPTRIYIVNDLEDGSSLKPTVVSWSVQDKNGKQLVSGTDNAPEVKHYGRYWYEPNIVLPASLPADKSNLKLVLKLTENGKTVSENEYELLVAAKSWNKLPGGAGKKVVLVDGDNTKKVFDYLQIPYQSEATVADALKQKADVCVFAGLKDCAPEEQKAIREYMTKGGKVLFLHGEQAVKAIFPEYITGWIKPTEGDISNMEIPESPVFNDIDWMELRYFNDNRREVPTVCSSAYQVTRDEQVLPLANHIKIHGYVNGDMHQRSEYVKTIKGFPLVQITEGKGTAVASGMSTEKATTDPIAGKLLVNILSDLLR